MDKVIEELVKSCKPFFSKRTRYLHFDGPYEKKHDTIPILENFCYAIALMRLKEKESFLEAKELIERLLEFQVNGNFPRYLHDYPRCYHNWQSIDLLPIYETIEKNFLSYFNEETKQKFLKSKRELEQHIATIQVFELEQFDDVLKEDGFEKFATAWNPFHLLLENISQEGFSPKETLMDHTLSYLHDSPSKKLGPEFLKLALVFPKHLNLNQIEPKPTLSENILFWKKNGQIDSLALFAQGDITSTQTDSKITFEIALPAKAVQDEKEIYFYINRNANPNFYSNQKRVNSFLLNSPLEIKTEGLNFRMEFEQDGSDAQFYGHVGLKNRDTQLLKDGEAYDYSIGIRTVRRTEKTVLKITILIE